MRSTLLRVTATAAMIALPLAACGSGGSSTTSSSSSSTGAAVVVHAKDSLKFDKQSYDAKAGSITIEYVNDGSLPHTLVIENHDEFKKLSVGDKDSGTTNLTAGTYTIYCDVTGHRSAGMEAKLVVS